MLRLPKTSPTLQDRPLGVIETRMALLHSRHAGTTQVTTIVRLRGWIGPGDLMARAKACFDRFPLLRCRIALRDEGLWFEEHDDLTRIECVSMPREDAEHWKREALNELNRPLDQGNALWRCRLLRDPAGADHELILTRAHAISDGQGTSELIDFWLSEEPSIRHAALPPSIDSWEAAPPSAPSARRLPLRTFPDPGAPRAHCHWFELSAGSTAAFEAQARENGLSLHSLLGARFVRACAAAGLGARLDLGFAASLRSRMGTEADDYKGVCAIGVATAQGLDACLPELELARAYGDAIRREAPRLPRRRQWSDRETLRSRILDIAGPAPSSQIGITDLGRVQVSTRYPRLEVVGFHSSASRRSGHPAVTLHASRLDGRLSLALTWAGEKLAPEVISNITRHLMEEK